MRGQPRPSNSAGPAGPGETMKILVLNPFAGGMQELERCRQVAGPDTEIVFEDISDVYPLSYVTYIYYRHRCADAVAERACRAQEEGFDALFICCCYDPGLWEARELVDIPVTAAFEAGCHYANAISQRYSVIATEYKTVHCYRELAQLYGAGSKLASVRHIHLSARESYPDRTDPQGGGGADAGGGSEVRGGGWGRSHPHGLHPAELPADGHRRGRFTGRPHHRPRAGGRQIHRVHGGGQAGGITGIESFRHLAEAAARTRWRYCGRQGCGPGSG